MLADDGLRRGRGLNYEFFRGGERLRFRRPVRRDVARRLSPGDVVHAEVHDEGARFYEAELTVTSVHYYTARDAVRLYVEDAD